MNKYSLSSERRTLYNNNNIYNNNINETPKIKNFIKTKEIKPMFIKKKKETLMNNNNHLNKDKNIVKIRKMNASNMNKDINRVSTINKKNKILNLNNTDNFFHISKNSGLNNTSIVDKKDTKNIKKNIIKNEEKYIIKNKLTFEKGLDKKSNFLSHVIPMKKIEKIQKNKNISKFENVNNKSAISNVNNSDKDSSNSNLSSCSLSNENEPEKENITIKHNFKRNITDNNVKKNQKMNLSNKNVNEAVKIVEFKSQNNPMIKNKNYLRRRSVDNPSIRERLEEYMNKIMLKQNGGNTLFLTNYEIGSTYEKEILFKINEKRIKRKIKISSCTKAGCSGPGIIKTNQDSFFIKENFNDNDSHFFIGVCDGDGEQGEHISNLVSSKLTYYINSLSSEEIISNFKKINSEIYSNLDINSDMSGTTVVSLIITPEKLISINLGDSRLTLFKYDNGIYYSKNLSREHKTCELDESNRIISCGGIIKKCFDYKTKKYFEPERVWLKNKEEPCLAMTRSLGDKISHNIGVIDEPEIKKFLYDGSEKFILIASDGLWEYLKSEQCINIVKKFYEEEKEPKEAALELTKEAFKRWKRKGVVIDDITVIVIFFY